MVEVLAATCQTLIKTTESFSGRILQPEVKISQFTEGGGGSAGGDLSKGFGL